MSETTPAQTQSPAPGRPQALIGIQYARALAAMLVVIFHLLPQFSRMGYTPTTWTGLKGGVDIFFVISGLIMWVTTCDSRISPREFLSRRIMRIVPLYWLATSFTVVLMILAPSVLQTARFDLKHIIASYAFVAWQHPTTGDYEPVVIPGWTLNYEMFFYVVFGALLLARRTKRLLLASAFFVILAGVGSLRDSAQNDEITFYTSPIMLEFVAGMCLGELFVRTHFLQGIASRFGWVLALAGLVLLIIGPQIMPELPRVLSSGVPALVVVTGVLALDSVGALRQQPLLLLLGDASYSLYLTHAFVLSALGQVWRKLHLDHLPFGLWSFAAVSVIVCCVVAMLCFWLIEVPLIAFFRKRRRRVQVI